jgi:curved DNA-binding protein CbpA
MNSVKKDIFKDKKLLTRFVWKLRFLPDTPALIQFVAVDEDYLLLCSRIVNAPNDRTRDFQLLEDICRKQEFDFQVLKEKLTPVARAFGLAEDESDHYELLGVSRDADPDEIKKAFRKRVLQVHPDTGDQKNNSSQEFIHLKAAYQILSDPFLRQQYDKNLQDENLWKEKANHIHRLNPLISQDPNQNQSAKTKIFYQLGGLFLLLIIAVFIFDFLYQQNSIFDGDHLKKQKQITKPKTLKAGVKQDSDNNTGQKSTEVKLLPNRSDNSRKIFKPGDSSQQANQKANAEVPDPVSINKILSADFAD